MKSIRMRLTVLFSVGVLVLMTAVEVVTVTLVENDLIESTYEQLVAIAKERALYVESEINTELQHITTLASHPILTDEEATFEEKVAFFKNQSKTSGFSTYAMTNRYGDSVVFNDIAEKVNIAERDYFIAAMQGKPTSSDLLVMNSTNELVIILAAPDYDNNQNVGVFYGRIDASILSDIVSKSKYKNTGFSRIINNEGITVADQDVQNVYKRVNEIKNAERDPALYELGEVTKLMTAREIGYGSYTQYDVEKMVGYAPIANTPWVVSVGVDKDEILNELAGIERVLIMVTVLGYYLGWTIWIS